MTLTFQPIALFWMLVGGVLSYALGVALPWAVLIGLFSPFIVGLVVESVGIIADGILSRYTRTSFARKRYKQRARRQFDKREAKRKAMRNRRGF